MYQNVRFVLGLTLLIGTAKTTHADELNDGVDHRTQSVASMRLPLVIEPSRLELEKTRRRYSRMTGAGIALTTLGSIATITMVSGFVASQFEQCSGHPCGAEGGGFLIGLIAGPIALAELSVGIPLLIVGNTGEKKVDRRIGKLSFAPILGSQGLTGGTARLSFVF